MKNENANPSLYDRLSEFASAVHGRTMGEQSFATPQEFCDEAVKRMESITDHVDAVIRMNVAHATAKATMSGEEYREYMEPYHRSCYRTLDNAGACIDGMNRLFALQGLEPFAEIPAPGKPDRDKAVADVCGRLALEGMGAEPGVNNYQRAIQEAQSGSPYAGKMAEMMRGIQRDRAKEAAAATGPAGPEAGA